MSVRSSSVDCADSFSTVHQWRGQPIGIKLTLGDNSRSLEIVPSVGAESWESHLSDARSLRLRRAADVALDLDATLGRAIKLGRAATLEVRSPRHGPAKKIERAHEAALLRPRVEELIAPLVLDTAPKPPLRPFQWIGVKWLTERRSGILADDMGLGKTAQALSALHELIESGAIRSALVVCPKSLLANWEEECQRWAPRLTVTRAAPSKEDSDEVWSALLRRSHLITTSYEQLRPIPEPLASETVELLIADEAHRLRSSRAKLVREFRLLRAERFWALTGTPIERHQSDLATLLSLLEPTRFSAKASTVEPGLKALARPYLLRRLKTDVLDELPDVIDTKETIELSPQQQRVYSSIVSRPLGGDGGEVLQRLTMLRSVCDADPESGSSAKLDRIVEILQNVHASGEKAVVFSYLLHPLQILADRMSREQPALGAVVLTGSLTTTERSQVLQKFKSDDGIVAILCSSRVGGEGLTLTEANHVIFINEWWNPSANAQARDRVVRLGQGRVVHVHRFRCKDTVEECLDLILERKTRTFASIVDALAVQMHLPEKDSQKALEGVLRRVSSA